MIIAAARCGFQLDPDRQPASRLECQRLISQEPCNNLDYKSPSAQIWLAGALTGFGNAHTRPPPNLAALTHLFSHP